MLTELFKKTDGILAIDTNWWPKGYTPANVPVIQIQTDEINLGKGMPVGLGLIGVQKLP